MIDWGMRVMYNLGVGVGGELQAYTVAFRGRTCTDA